MALQAFVDDSSADSDHEKRLVLAGYMAPYEQWEDFSDEWDRELQRDKPLRRLHMKDCWRGFDAKQRNDKLDALIAVLAKSKPASIECSVSRTAFNKILRPHIPHDLKHPYYPCFYGVVLGGANFAISRGMSGPIDFVFDEQGNVGAAAALWYLPTKHLLTPQLAPMLGSPPIFRDDQCVMPLQAADMLAWHVRRSLEGRASQQNLGHLDAMLFQHARMEISEELLSKWAHAFSQMPGIELVKKKSVRRGVEQGIKNAGWGDPFQGSD